MTRGPGGEEVALHRAVDEVLHYLWDPIGVAGVVDARGEYAGYVDAVCDLLWRQADAAAIAAHLERIACDAMGVDGARARCESAAGTLLAWHRAIVR